MTGVASTRCPASARSRSLRISAADWYRLAGFLLIAFSRIASSSGGISGLIDDGSRGVLPDVLVGHRDGGVAAERRRAGDELVEQAAHRVDVGAGVHALAAGLLGGEVLGGADHRGGGVIVAAESETARAMPKSITLTCPGA